MYTGKHRVSGDNSNTITILRWSSESRKSDSNPGAWIGVFIVVAFAVKIYFREILCNEEKTSTTPCLKSFCNEYSVCVTIFHFWLSEVSYWRKVFGLKPKSGIFRKGPCLNPRRRERVWFRTMIFCVYTYAQLVGLNITKFCRILFNPFAPRNLLNIKFYTICYLFFSLIIGIKKLIFRKGNSISSKYTWRATQRFFIKLSRSSGF